MCPIYNIKTTIIYEFEASNDVEAISKYNSHEYHDGDIVAYDTYELGYIDENDEYVNITPKEG